FQRRLVRRCEWLSFMPKIGFLPQTSQTEAMRISRGRGSTEPGEAITSVGLTSMLTSLTASDLRQAVLRFRDALRAHQEELNRLNVYPVPDGDTGTNMALTLESVSTALDNADSMDEGCHAISRGSLMGARGNSGV